MNDRLKFRWWNGTAKRFEYFDFENPKKFSDYMCQFIEQCTGLKDKNGKLVFENDVVNIDSSTVNICDTRAIVIFEDGSFILQWIPKGSGADKLRRVKKLFNHDVGNIRWWEIEVIGNIHQNRELLEKGGK